MTCETKASDTPSNSANFVCDNPLFVNNSGNRLLPTETATKHLAKIKLRTFVLKCGIIRKLHTKRMVLRMEDIEQKKTKLEQIIKNMQQDKLDLALEILLILSKRIG